MTSPTGNRRTGTGDGRPAGFTLIELMLVMALLTIMVSLAAPSLSRFFRGRTLDSEARRLLALTRYGQSRAVSEGVPMVLWIDARENAYGLRTGSSYTVEDSRAVEFDLDEDLRIEVETPDARSATSRTTSSSRMSNTRTLSGSTRTRSGNSAASRGTLQTEIVFTPDGFIGEDSPEWVAVMEGEKGAVWIARSRNRLNYEIQTNMPPVQMR